MQVLGRIRRDVIEGEIVAVRLELVRDVEVVEIQDGDEFVTVEIPVDPWAPKG